MHNKNIVYISFMFVQNQLCRLQIGKARQMAPHLDPTPLQATTLPLVLIAQCRITPGLHLHPRHFDPVRTCPLSPMRFLGLIVHYSGPIPVVNVFNQAYKENHIVFSACTACSMQLFDSQLRLRVSQALYDRYLYKWHSFRIGAATKVATLGTRMIKYKQYFRISE